MSHVPRNVFFGSGSNKGRNDMPVIGELLGPDLLIVLGILVLLFGGSQIPKLARSLGQASKEFKSGLAQGAEEDESSS
jgi:sec-independent protein translocase protein TatA